VAETTAGVILAVGGEEEPVVTRLLMEFVCTRCGGAGQAEGVTGGQRSVSGWCQCGGCGQVYGFAFVLGRQEGGPSPR